MKAIPKDSEFRASSGNVFKDLNVPQPEQELVKAGLVSAICANVSKRALKQADVAALLRTTQPKVSLLLRGRTAGFSTDALMRFLNRLGQSIDIVLATVSSSKPTGKTRVCYESLPRVAGKTAAYTVSRSAGSSALGGVAVGSKYKRAARVGAMKKK